MPILLSRCVKCFLWQVRNLAVAFKQSCKAGMRQKLEVHTVFIKTSIKHVVFITFAFPSNKKWEIMKPRVQTKLMGSSFTRTQGLLLRLSPLIFTNFCTCWLRFYRSITLWHFTRNPTSPLNSYQCLRSLLRLAIGEAYQHYMEPSSHLLGENEFPVLNITLKGVKFGFSNLIKN